MTDGVFNTKTVSIADGPTIEFFYSGDVVRAELEGAKLYGELCGPDTVDLRLTDANGEILADIIVKPRSHRTITENVMDIGSALLWSHWRYLQSKPKPSPFVMCEKCSSEYNSDDGSCPVCLMIYEPRVISDMDDCREED